VQCLHTPISQYTVVLGKMLSDVVVNSSLDAFFCKLKHVVHTYSTRDRISYETKGSDDLQATAGKVTKTSAGSRRRVSVVIY